MIPNYELSTNKNYGERAIGDMVDENKTGEDERSRLVDRFKLGKFKCF